MSQMQYGGIGWSPYYGGYPQPTPITPPVQKMEVIRVHGEEGANAFAMAPNSSAIFLDETQPAVWLKTTDGAGYATVTGYDITPKAKVDPTIVAQEKPVEVDTFKDDVLARLDRLERMIENNVKPYAQSNKQPNAGKSNSGRSDQANDANGQRI